MESIEQTAELIKVNNQECECKIHAEQQRQKEVSNVLQQISKLQNDLKGPTEESGMCANKSCICSVFSTILTVRLPSAADKLIPCRNGF